METRRILSEISKHINDGNITFDRSFPYLYEALNYKLLRHAKGNNYVLNFDIYISHLIKELGIKRLQSFSRDSLYCGYKRTNKKAIIFLCFIQPYEDSTAFFVSEICKILGEITQYGSAVIPFIFAAEKFRRLLEKDTKAKHKLSELYLSNLKILSLPIIFPYPELVGNKDFLKSFRKAITEVKKALKEIVDIKEYENEYYTILEYRTKFWSKILVSFAQLDHILKRYSIVKMKKRWKGPSKWFEETIKLLLIDLFVKGRFRNKRVEKFLLNYKTGGRKADIIVPVRAEDDEAIIWIVDTKHWERDFCKAIGKGHERLTKYTAYVDKNNEKSRPVWKLIKLLEDIGIKRIKFHLVFIQRTSKSCNLEIPELKKYYDKVTVKGLNEISKLLANT